MNKMSLQIILRLRNNNVIRKYSTMVKKKVIPDQNLLKDIEKEKIKPRQHPGIMKPRTVTLPDFIVKAAQNVTEDFPLKSILSDSQQLNRHLKNKVPPLEKQELDSIKRNTTEKVLAKCRNVQINSEEEQMNFKNMVKVKVQNILIKSLYNWKAILYDTYNSLVYLFSRSPAEYAVLIRVFAEISNRDPTFKPRSLFDFGSGVGSVTWAVNAYWKQHIFEYFNVDLSADMNDLAQSLLQGGRGNKSVPIKGVFYRQFLPATNNTYDLVVSAYSLLELPSMQSRLQTVLNLWNKTQKYLVIIEQGSNAGFKVINEVRDFLLFHCKDQGHVFSPCPHDSVCPRFSLNDGTPCNFVINYFGFPVGNNYNVQKELYSYVILKRGQRDENDPQWPRVVREVLVRSKHSICRTCTKEGKLEEFIFTASKNGKNAYHCARATKWGDLLPITTETDIEENKDDFTT